MSKARWIVAGDASLLVIQIVLLVRLFAVHPTGDRGFDGALRVAGELLLGLLMSGTGLTFAAVTRKHLEVQRWFGLVSLLTSLAWGGLFLLASVAV